MATDRLRVAVFTTRLKISQLTNGIFNMASKSNWLADYYSQLNNWGKTDSYTIRDAQGNPVGQPYNSQYSGSNVKILTTTDVTFNVNSLAVAQRNTARIQAIIDAMPDSGGAIGIPHDIALTSLTFPMRTMTNPGGTPITGQPINFEIFGTRPGVQIYGMSTDPVFTVVPGCSGVVHTPTRTVLQRIRDLSITCRGIGVYVKYSGASFTADNVEIRTESSDDNKPAWFFKDCYGMHLGRVGAVNSYQGIGFKFDFCIHVSFAHLWSRGNKIGVQTRTTQNPCELSDGRCGNFFGNWDVEGNHDWQLDLEWLQKSSLNVYMEGAKRISMTNCENLEFKGDGVRVDYVDANGLLLNPKLFEVQYNRIEPGTHYASFGAGPPTLVSTGTYSWTYSWTAANTAVAHWVKPAWSVENFNSAGKTMVVRFRAKGTGAGTVIANFLWNLDGVVWQSVAITPSTDWVEYSTEPGTVGSQTVSAMYVVGNNGTDLEFELMHIAYISRKEDYTVG